MSLKVENEENVINMEQIKQIIDEKVNQLCHKYKISSTDLLIKDLKANILKAVEDNLRDNSVSIYEIIDANIVHFGVSYKVYTLDQEVKALKNDLSKAIENTIKGGVCLKELERAAAELKGHAAEFYVNSNKLDWFYWLHTVYIFWLILFAIIIALGVLNQYIIYQLRKNKSNNTVYI